MGYHGGGGGGALTVFDEGTIAATAVEQSFTVDTSNEELGSYQLVVDVSSLQVATGDQYRFRLYLTAPSTGTQRLVELGTVNSPTPALFIASIPPMFGPNWQFTVQKLAGADRSLPWQILRRP